MAVDLMRRPSLPLRLALAGAAVGLAGAAQALGPTAPFTPPAPRPGAAQAAAAPASGAEGAGPAAAASAALVGLRLRSHPMALIDGRWSRLGDTVRGGRITSIEVAGVHLSHPDGRTEFLAWNLLPDPPAVAPNLVVRTSTP